MDPGGIVTCVMVGFLGIFLVVEVYEYCVRDHVPNEEDREVFLVD